jgi:alkaline phosphatase
MKRIVSIAVLSAAAGAVHAQSTLPQANDSYFRSGQSALQEHLGQSPNTNRAKNVILFVGDGMGISTVTPRWATRMALGR